jgi:hypothetical protein
MIPKLTPVPWPEWHLLKAGVRNFRHSRGSGNPGRNTNDWIPARRFAPAGMTVLPDFLLSKDPRHNKLIMFWCVLA